MSKREKYRQERRAEQRMWSSALLFLGVDAISMPHPPTSSIHLQHISCSDLRIYTVTFQFSIF